MGEIIGQMRTQYISVVTPSIRRSLLGLEFRQSTNGRRVKVDGRNAILVNPAPFFDLTAMTEDYLSLPMASLVKTYVTRAGGTLTNEDIRYTHNLDLEEGEVYLRRYFEFLYYTQTENPNPDEFENIFTWNDDGTISVELFDEILLFFPEGMYNGQRNSDRKNAI